MKVITIISLFCLAEGSAVAEDSKWVGYASNVVDDKIQETNVDKPTMGERGFKEAAKGGLTEDAQSAFDELVRMDNEKYQAETKRNQEKAEASQVDSGSHASALMLQQLARSAAELDKVVKNNIAVMKTRWQDRPKDFKEYTFEDLESAETAFKKYVISTGKVTGDQLKIEHPATFMDQANRYNQVALSDEYATYLQGNPVIGKQEYRHHGKPLKGALLQTSEATDAATEAQLTSQLANDLRTFAALPDESILLQRTQPTQSVPQPVPEVCTRMKLSQNCQVEAQKEPTSDFYQAENREAEILAGILVKVDGYYIQQSTPTTSEQEERRAEEFAQSAKGMEDYFFRNSPASSFCTVRKLTEGRCIVTVDDDASVWDVDCKCLQDTAIPKNKLKLLLKADTVFANDRAAQETKRTGSRDQLIGNSESCRSFFRDVPVDTLQCRAGAAAVGWKGVAGVAALSSVDQFGKALAGVAEGTMEAAEGAAAADGTEARADTSGTRAAAEGAAEGGKGVAAVAEGTMKAGSGGGVQAASPSGEPTPFGQ